MKHQITVQDIADSMKVVEQFISINGEGQKAGQLALFVRFAGCNLQCEYCDTKWANEADVSYTEYSPEELVDIIMDAGIKNITLTGHSYGGYFAYYTLFHSDTIARNTFENYYIGSPSMQAHTGKKYIRNYEQEYYERCKELNANVYITVGSEENSGFISGVESFEKSLEERNYDGLNIRYEVIQGYGHDTVFKPSIRNALELFYGKSDDGR